MFTTGDFPILIMFVNTCPIIFESYVAVDSIQEFKIFFDRF